MRVAGGVGGCVLGVRTPKVPPGRFRDRMPKRTHKVGAGHGPAPAYCLLSPFGYTSEDYTARDAAVEQVIISSTCSKLTDLGLPAGGGLEEDGALTSEVGGSNSAPRRKFPQDTMK